MRYSRYTTYVAMIVLSLVFLILGLSYSKQFLLAALDHDPPVRTRHLGSDPDPSQPYAQLSSDGSYALAV